MIVFAPSVEVTDKTAPKLIEKVVGTEGMVSDVTLLGKKQLAYPIKKFTEGTYVLATVTGAHVIVSEIEKKIQLGTDVIRYLLTLKK